MDVDSSTLLPYRSLEVLKVIILNHFSWGCFSLAFKMEGYNLRSGPVLPIPNLKSSHRFLFFPSLNLGLPPSEA